MPSGSRARTPLLGAELKRQREALPTPRRSLRAVSARLASMGITVTNSTLSKYESGRQPDLRTLAALARIYNCQLSALVGLLATDVLGPTVADGVTSGVKPADNTGPGENNQEEALVNRLNGEAIILGIELMKIPEEQQEAARHEAAAMFKRRYRAGRPREDRAEGDR